MVYCIAIPTSLNCCLAVIVSTGHCVQTSFLVGAPGDLSAALHIVERDGPSVPLLASISTEASPSSLSRKGCVASLSPLPPEVPVTREGFSLLGCPIGPPSFCEEVLQGRVSKLKESLGLLHEMGDSHLVATLLCSCFALPKFSCVIRTCPPSHVSQACWNVDCTIFGVHPWGGGGASDCLVLAEGLPPQQSRWFSTCGVPRSMPLPLSWHLPCSPRR